MAEAIGRESPDAVWCLGDVVGYGPDPNGCCDWVEAGTSICLAGNHDLGVLGKLDLEDFAGEAKTSASWTRTALSTEARSFLSRLESSASTDGASCFHASPSDPVWEYVLTWEAARKAIDDSGAVLTLIGHSHIPLAIGEHDGVGHAPGGTEVDLSDGRWLLNPGSVGQPRDGDPDAAWLLLDLDARRATFARVPYDVARTQAAIRDLGLPDVLAERLAHGV